MVGMDEAMGRTERVEDAKGRTETDVLDAKVGITWDWQQFYFGLESMVWHLDCALIHWTPVECPCCPEFNRL